MHLLSWSAFIIYAHLSAHWYSTSWNAYSTASMFVHDLCLIFLKYVHCWNWLSCETYAIDFLPSWDRCTLGLLVLECMHSLCKLISRYVQVELVLCEVRQLKLDILKCVCTLELHVLKSVRNCYFCFYLRVQLISTTLRYVQVILDPSREMCKKHLVIWRVYNRSEVREPCT